MDGGSSSQPSTMTQTSIPEYANPYVRAMLGQAMKTVFNIQPVQKMASGGSVDGTSLTDNPYVNGDPRIVGNFIASNNTTDPAASAASGAPNSVVDGYNILGLKPIETYQGLGADTYRTAGLTDLQKQSAANVSGMGTNIGDAQTMVPQYQNARNAVGLAGLASAQAGRYSPTTFNTNYKAGEYQPGQFSGSYQPGQFGVNYQAGRFSPDYYQGTFDTRSVTDPSALDAYMSPYMQNVVDINKREAIRDASKQNLTQQAQATQAGAFGGGRDALMRSENLRNLNQHLGDIQNTGTQAAYQSAVGQFNTEAAQRFAAQQAREQAKQFGTNASMQAQQLGEQSRQFGSGLDLQAQQLGEQSRQFGTGIGMQAQQLGEQSRQFGAGLGEQSRQFGANLGLQGQQAGEQSRQFGANLKLQGLQQQLNAAVAQGQMTQAEADQRLRAGQMMFDQQAGIATLQNQMGGQQQANQQQQINNAYTDFVNQQNYPYKQLGFLSDMLRGLPLANVSTYQAPPSPISQIAGLGTAGIAGLGLYNSSRG